MRAPVVQSHTANWKNYIVALVITAAMFFTAFFASNYLNDRRVADIRATQDDISTDILSIETQFDLLQEYSCNNVTENTILPSALTALGSQLSYMESQRGNADEVLRLKRLYSLLEIKDYLLMKQIAQKCKLKPVFILYFYSNQGNDCKDCELQGYVLTALAEKYPQLRIYSFDYGLDISALKTLISIDNVKNQLPALIINGEAHYGLQKIDAIEKIVPQLASMKAATTTSSTSTKLK